jgi:hypothetical protein
MLEEFESFTFDDFKQNFLVEGDLDKSPRIRLGELSRTLSKVNIDVARKLNRWAANILTKVDRYIKRLRKRPGGIISNVSIRHIPVGDGRTEAAAIIIISISGVGDVETSIFDNNQITIKMPTVIANAVNKGKTRKFISNKDKVPDYLIGILEKVA